MALGTMTRGIRGMDTLTSDEGMGDVAGWRPVCLCHASMNLPSPANRLHAHHTDRAGCGVACLAHAVSVRAGKKKPAALGRGRLSLGMT
jgi:hypothetical protein